MSGVRIEGVAFQVSQLRPNELVQDVGGVAGPSLEAEPESRTRRVGTAVPDRHSAEPVDMPAVESAVALVAELLERLAAGGGVFSRFDVPEVQQGTGARVRVGLVAPKAEGIETMHA